jgi:hypothetical protein
MKLSLKIGTAGGMAQVVDSLPRKHKALSSNFSIVKNNNKRKTLGGIVLE